MLSQHRIDEFKVIMQSRYGVLLSDEEAREQAERLVAFFEELLRPRDGAE